MARIAVIGVWLLALALPAAAQYPDRPATMLSGCGMIKP